jgi:hypothetical protein
LGFGGLSKSFNFTERFFRFWRALDSSLFFHPPRPARMSSKQTSRSFARITKVTPASAAATTTNPAPPLPDKRPRTEESAADPEEDKTESPAAKKAKIEQPPPPQSNEQQQQQQQHVTEDKHQEEEEIAANAKSVLNLVETGLADFEHDPAKDDNVSGWKHRLALFMYEKMRIEAAAAKEQAKKLEEELKTAKNNVRAQAARLMGVKKTEADRERLLKEAEELTKQSKLLKEENEQMAQLIVRNEENQAKEVAELKAALQAAEQKKKKQQDHEAEQTKNKAEDAELKAANKRLTAELETANKRLADLEKTVKLAQTTTSERDKLKGERDTMLKQLNAYDASTLAMRQTLKGALQLHAGNINSAAEGRRKVEQSFGEVSKNIVQVLQAAFKDLLLQTRQLSEQEKLNETQRLDEQSNVFQALIGENDRSHLLSTQLHQQLSGGGGKDVVVVLEQLVVPRPAPHSRTDEPLDFPDLDLGGGGDGLSSSQVDRQVATLWNADQQHGVFEQQ